MKIMVVDDSALVRDGIISLLEGEGHQVVAEAAEGAEAISKLDLAQPDVILMDVRMPQMNGLEATRIIKTLHPKMKVVMLTASDEEEDLFEAIRSGADGYLLKDLTAGDFFQELYSIHRGEAVVSKVMAGKLLQEFRSLGVRAKGEPKEPLSSRELDVLQLVVQGFSNREVGEHLFITENTVKYHMKQILTKLQMGNRAQAAAWASRHLPGAASGRSPVQRV